MTPARPGSIWFQPLASMWEMARLATESATAFVTPLRDGRACDISFASETRSLAELTTMSLRIFEPDVADEVPVLLEAPFAIHDAAIVDLASGHSIVEALRREARRRLAVTAWHSADVTLAGLTIDSYLADLNVAVDRLGGRVDLVGLCQGGWMALVYAATFPHKVRRLVLVGAPIDTEVDESFVTLATRAPAGAWLQPALPNVGLVSTRSLFYPLIATTAGGEEMDRALQLDPESRASSSEVVARYRAWNWRNFDLPSAYFAQVERWLFAENLLVKGAFPAFGQPVDLRQVRCPVFVLTGEADAFSPPAQSLGLGSLIGTPATQVQAHTVPGCSHLGLFLGRETLRHWWPRVAAFLNAA